MKSSLINLYKGYFSILKYIFTGRNDGRFLQLNFKLPFVLITLMIIGFTRNLLAVIFGITSDITTGWHSMRPDIVLVMIIFPAFLCFFGAMILSFLVGSLDGKKRNGEILSFCFYLQILHLLVHPLDIINFKFDISYYFQIFPQSFVYYFINHLLVMTIGIMVVWLLSGTAVIRFLKDICRISLPKIFLIAFLTFNFLFWPIYIIFPFSNYLFNSLLPIDEMEEISNFMRGAYSLFYGYAVFFLILALAGIIYFRKHFSKSRGKAES